MGKSSKSRDRAAVAAQLRKEQQSAERRRTAIVVGAAALVGAVVIGLAAKSMLDEEARADRGLSAIGTAAGDAGCQEVTTVKATGSADHKDIGTKIEYPDAPPAFGPHWPQWAPLSRKFYTAEDRPEPELLVHNLEHGYTILWYDQTIADDEAALGDLEDIAGNFPSATDLHDKFIVAPWTEADGDNPFPEGTHLALTHWSMGGTHGNEAGQLGVWRFCAAPSGPVVADFIDDYPYTDSPEPTAA